MMLFYSMYDATLQARAMDQLSYQSLLHVLGQVSHAMLPYLIDTDVNLAEFFRHGAEMGEEVLIMILQSLDSSDSGSRTQTPPNWTHSEYPDSQFFILFNALKTCVP